MTQRRRTKSQVVTEFRNAEILDAARRVFAAQGFEGASVEEIARVAGVAKGTVYLYYPSKEAIYRAALGKGLAGLGAELRQRVEAATTLREKVRAYVETKTAYCEEHRDFLKIYLAAFGDLAQPMVCQRELQGLKREQIALLEAALKARSRQERLRPVRTEAAAHAIFDLTRGAITRRLGGRSRRETEKDVGYLLDFIWKGLGVR